MLAETDETLSDTGQTAKTTYSYDQYNNQTDAYESDYNATTLLRHTNRVFLTNYNGYSYDGYSTANPAASIHIRDRVSTETVSDGAGTISQKQFFYAQFALTDLGAIEGHDGGYTATYTTRGNATTQQSFVSGTSSISVTGKYDTAGNLVQTTDGNANVTNVGYSSPDWSFPVTVNKTVGLQSFKWTRGYDPSTGLVTSFADPNNNPTHYQYFDNLDRLTTVTRPDLGTTQFLYIDSTLPSSVTTRTDQINPAYARLVFEVLSDGMGRRSQSRTYEDGNPGGTNYIFVEQTYNALGRPYQVSQPHRQNVGANCSSALCITTNYDALGRVVAVVGPEGSTTNTSYNGNITTVSDPLNVTRSATLDAAGRITLVVENLSASTNYLYDASDRLAKVCQGAAFDINHNCQSPGQVRQFAYDLLGRVTGATNPETSTGAQIGGTTYYAYDGNGNVTSKTDPRGITTSMGYDALNRIVAKSYSDGTPGVTYCYDGNVYSGGLCVTASPPVSNPLGNLTQVYSSASTTSYSAYDALGRVQVSTQQTPAVNGMSFSFGAVGQPGYSYNLAGEITSTTYPSGRQVSYDYDNAGRTAHVRDPRAVGIAFADLSSNPPQGSYAYAPHGGVQFLTLGNGVTENTVWDPGSLQPHQITAAGSNNMSLLSLQYSFCQSGTSCTNNNGNVWQQTITTPAATRVQTYGYDGFNRLISAQESTTQGSPWSQNYQYDASGNRAVVSGYLPYPSLTPSALSQYSENYGSGPFNRNHWTGATYDAGGNMTGIPGATRSFTYDAENRITSASEPFMGAIAYTYDGDGRRVTKTVAGAVTTFVYDAQGQMVAEYGTVLPDMGTKYLTADMLGSTRLVTDPAGLVALKRYDYYPFGEDLQQGTGGRDTSYAAGIYPGVPDTEAMKFTGKERDAETGLDFFGARYLSGAMGRYTSPDPVFFQAEMLTDPQRFNQYSYVRNNPLRYVDPKGEKIELTGTDEERRRQLAAIQSAVGKGSDQLTLVQDEKSGKYFVDIQGDAAAFSKISDVAAGFANVIQDPEIAKFKLVGRYGALVSWMSRGSR